MGYSLNNGIFRSFNKALAIFKTVVLKLLLFRGGLLFRLDTVFYCKINFDSALNIARIRSGSKIRLCCQSQILKGVCHEIFDLIFCIDQPHLVLDFPRDIGNS